MATALHPKEDYRPNTSPKPVRDWLLKPLFGSSVGGKAVVAVTGLLLTGFTIAHLTGNLLIFSGSDALNGYAHFLKEKAFILWGFRLGLLATFIVHLVLALRLNYRNRKARPVRYEYEKTVAASWESRHMVSTGIVLGLFILFHLAHFTLGAVKVAKLDAPAWVVVGSADGKELVQVAEKGTRVNYLALREKVEGHGFRHDVYSMVYYGFKNEYVTLAYVILQVALLLHLTHGISSTFQSLGWNNARWAPLLRWAGRAIALVIFLGNISIPLYVFAGSYYGFVRPLGA
jgi:succinate dehydrogenase / fumarate reductase cytochrome b subunit